MTAILNVQNHADFSRQKVDWSETKAWYAARGIKAVHFPIVEDNEADLNRLVQEGADALNSLISEGKKVYVHCNGGSKRSTTVVAVYFCLYRPEEDYGSTEDDLAGNVDVFIRKFRAVSQPNMNVVRNVLSGSPQWE